MNHEGHVLVHCCRGQGQFFLYYFRGQPILDGELVLFFRNFSMHSCLGKIARFSSHIGFCCFLSFQLPEGKEYPVDYSLQQSFIYRSSVKQISKPTVIKKLMKCYVFLWKFIALR